jgi:hypothetical protein
MAASAARTNALNAFAKIFAETSPRLQSAAHARPSIWLTKLRATKSAVLASVINAMHANPFFEPDRVFN